MTPKEAYEARKAERKRRAAERGNYREPSEDVEAFMELADRFVTAVERIADALENGAPKGDAPT